MKYRGKIPPIPGTYPPRFDPSKRPSTSAHYSADNAMHDIFGRLLLLDSSRPITRWTRIKAFLCISRGRSLRSGFFNKPKVIRASDGKKAVLFDGKQVMKGKP